MGVHLILQSWRWSRHSHQLVQLLTSSITHHQRRNLCLFRAASGKVNTGSQLIEYEPLQFPTAATTICKVEGANQERKLERMTLETVHEDYILRGQDGEVQIRDFVPFRFSAVPTKSPTRASADIEELSVQSLLDAKYIKPLTMLVRKDQGKPRQESNLSVESPVYELVGFEVDVGSNMEVQPPEEDIKCHQLRLYPDRSKFYIINQLGKVYSWLEGDMPVEIQVSSSWKE